MQLVTIEQVEKTVDIELPAFFGTGGLQYRVDGEKDYTQIITWDDKVSIERNKWRVPNAVLNSGKSTKAAFENAKQKALSILTRDLFMEASTPASEDDIREKIWDDISSDRNLKEAI